MSNQLNIKNSLRDKLADHDFLPVLYAHKKAISLCQANLDSYNRLVKKDIGSILARHSPITCIITNAGTDTNTQFKETRIEVRFDDWRLEKPAHKDTKIPLFPNAARNDRHYYSSQIVISRSYKIFGVNPTTKAEQLLEEGKDPEMIPFTYIPAMFRSFACITDGMSEAEIRHIGEDTHESGGYLPSCMGQEKVVIAQDEKASNEIRLNHDKTKDIYKASVKCRDSSMLYTDTPGNFTISLTNKNIIEAHVNLWGQTDIPIVLLMQALGASSDRIIAEYLIGDTTDQKMADMIMPSFNSFLQKDSSWTQTYLSNFPEAVDWSTEYRALYVINRMLRAKKQHKMEKDDDHEWIVKDMRHKITRSLLQHLDDNNRIKCAYIGLMVRNVILYKLGDTNGDDPYNYGNRRIYGPGILLGMVFDQTVRDYATEFRKTITNETKKNSSMKISELKQLIENFSSPEKIENNINQTVYGNRWRVGSAYYQASKSKISMLMDRKSRLDPMCIQRKVATGVGKNNTSNEVRQQHASSDFYLDPNETPEGDKIGVFKHYSLLSFITVNNPEETEFVYSMLSKIHATEGDLLIDLRDVPPSETNHYIKIFINGNWKYLTEKPFEIYNRLIAERRSGNLTYMTVCYDYNVDEIRIYTDAGRILRPLYVVDQIDERKLSLKMTPKMMHDQELDWTNLIREGIIEYVSIHELQHNCVVAMYPSIVYAADARFTRYTHCEIHPSTLQGINSGLIPFANSDPSQRVTFQCAMGKQAMDIYNLNFHNRMDIFVHIMPYVQQPLVTTAIASYIEYDRYPAGMNAIVAVMSRGRNMEDSIIVDENYVKRNGFVSVNEKTYLVDLNTKGIQKFEKPPEDATDYKKNANYNNIRPDGQPIVGKRVKKGDIIVGIIQRVAGTGQVIDRSVEYTELVPGIITKVHVSTPSNDSQFIKVKIRMIKRVIRGDKFSARHGQKGTTGEVRATIDMPFSEDYGITPNIIINPHCIPSRMTIAQKKEGIASLLAAILGVPIDATTFVDHSMEPIYDMLDKLGFDKHGEMVMRDGETGERIDTKIYMVPNYYQRLKHIVDGKIYARSTGSRQKSTRQPVGGKKGGGGVRIGVMERDVFLAHGASELIIEKFFYNSDPFIVHVCNDCGLFCPGNSAEKYYKCINCKKNTNIYAVKMPYATKRVMQEIQTLNMSMRLVLDP